MTRALQLDVTLYHLTLVILLCVCVYTAMASISVVLTTCPLYVFASARYFTRYVVEYWTVLILMCHVTHVTHVHAPNFRESSPPLPTPTFPAHVA